MHLAMSLSLASHHAMMVMAMAMAMAVTLQSYGRAYAKIMRSHADSLW